MHQVFSIRRAHPLALTLTLAMGLPACGSSDDEQNAANQPSSTTVDETTTAPPETTTTAAPTPEEEVLAAYAAHWKAVRDAFDLLAAEPDLPALRRHTTGEVLRYAVENAQKALQEEEAYVVPANDASNHRVEVLSVDGDTATVRDCTIDETVVINTVTGEVVDDAVSTRLYTGMLVREDGVWKTAVLRREADWDGVEGCALE
jgi:hypothetical protein